MLKQARAADLLDADVAANVDAPPAALNARIAMNLAVDRALSGIAIRDLDVSGTLEGDPLPGGRQDVDLAAPAVDLNLDAQTLALPELSLEALGIKARVTANGKAIVDAPEIVGTLAVEPFSPRDLIVAMGEEAPVTADGSVLGLLEATAGFAYAGDTAELTDLAGRRVTDPAAPALPGGFVLGEAPEAALPRLRQARPCAVETDAQMDWAMQGEA